MNRNWLLYFIPAIILSMAMVACSATDNIPKNQKDQNPVQQAKFEISPLSVTPRWLFTGTDATVSATVKNTGDADGSYKAIFFIDGQKSGEKEIQVSRGQSQTVSFPVPGTGATDKSVAIGDSKTLLSYYSAKSYNIQYDNYDSQDGTAFTGWYAPEPYGQIVRFTATAKPFRVTQIQMAAFASFKSLSDQGRVFTMNIWDSNRKKLWTADFPWKTYGSDAWPTWQDLDVPNILVDDDFYVELVSHTPANEGDWRNMGTSNWFGLGTIKSAFRGRSSYSYQGQVRQSTTKAGDLVNYCIRVKGEGGPNQVLYYDGGAATTYTSASDYSNVVAFKAPSYPFTLNQVQVYGYCDSKENVNRTVDLKVIDKKTSETFWEKSIPWSEVPYSGIKLGEWVDIDTGGITCKRDFYVEVTTNSGTDSAIWLGCDTTPMNRYSDMSSGGSIISWRAWEDTSGKDIKTYSRDNTQWMIRAVGIPK